MKQSTATLSLRKGRISRPQKAVIYGPEGVGKSTLAGSLPEPVFLDLEGGTHHLDVARIESCSTWEEITAAIGLLAKGGHGFRTLVVDTADWAEKRLVEWLCHKHGKDSIEDFGYGKGYVLLAEEFAKFLGSLDGLLARGMHVLFLAHATVRKFEAPDQAGSYDRFELKLSKQVAPLLKEWSDALIFGTYVTKTVEKQSGKLRGVGGKERVLLTTHTAAYDAKNRHGLADKLPFTVEALAPVFGAAAESGGSVAAKPAAEATKPEPAEAAMTVTDRIFATFQHVVDMADVVDFLIDRGQLGYDSEGSTESLDKLDPAYVARIFAEPKRFAVAVREWADARKEATK